MEVMQTLEQIIYKINEDNVETAIQSTLNLFDQNFPYTFHLMISRFLYSISILPEKNKNLIFQYLQILNAKEEENHKLENNLINVFSNYLLGVETQDSYFLLEELIDKKLIEPNIVKNLMTYVFAHYHTPNFKGIIQYTSEYNKKYEEISKNDWKLHKQLIKEGHNPNAIAKILVNDEIEKLQEISSQNYFDFNQIIQPSLYERHSFINQSNVSMIDYCAFFGAIKCFKYLKQKNPNGVITGKYAIAGGNLEIVHLCEQNNSSFEGAYEAAIQFHRNDIFYYLYKNKIGKIVDKSSFTGSMFQVRGGVGQARCGVRCSPNNIQYTNNLTQENINYLGQICIQYNNFKILSFLIQEGMNINDISDEILKSGNTYLFNSIKESIQISNSTFLQSIQSGNPEIVKAILKEKEIDINAENDFGETALMIASRFDKIEIVRFLLEQKGINVNSKRKTGQTVLMIATLTGDVELVKLLLEQKGIEINAGDRWKQTSLMIATMNGLFEIVKLLLEQNDIEIEAKNDLGQTAFLLASSNDNIDIIQLFLEKNINVMNEKNNDGQTALMIASSSGNIDIFKLLLRQKGTDINAKDNNGQTALILASASGHIEIVKLLLEQKGIEINARDNYEQSAIMLATLNNHFEIVKLLLEQNGIEVNAKDNSGRTVFLYASSNGNIELVKNLILKGVDINAKDNDGQNAYIYACKNNNTELKNLLEQEGIEIDMKLVEAVCNQKPKLFKSKGF